MNLGRTLKIEVIEAPAPLHDHNHGEVWLRVQGDEVLSLPTVRMQLSDQHKAMLEGCESKPCAYYPDLPQTDEELADGRFIDWWVFPRVVARREESEL